MKTALTRALFAGLATFVIISCRKSDVPDQSQSRVESTEATVASPPAIRLENGSLLSSSGVTITAPEQVNVDETFNIAAAIECGRVAIERGYILVNGLKVYNGLTCNTPGIMWEGLVNFQCASNDATTELSFDEPGTYVFQTKHNPTASGQCTGAGNANCSFSGNEFCCFVIEAVDGCETSFTGKTDLCENGQRSVTYTFTSAEALDYFKIQGGLTNFTDSDPDATVVVTGGTEIEKWQDNPGGSSNRTIRVEGKIAACETITIVITWGSGNSGSVITGQWSVKGADGLNIADPVAGLTCSEE